MFRLSFGADFDTRVTQRPRPEWQLRFIRPWGSSVVGSALAQRVLLEPSPPGQDSLLAAKVHVVRGNIAERFVITLGVVVVDEVRDRLLQFRRRFPHDQVDLLFAGSVVPLNLAVGLRMVRRSENMSQAFRLQIVPEPDSERREGSEVLQRTGYGRAMDQRRQ